MKKLFSVLVFIVSIATVGFSQKSSVYTCFVNVVSEEFRFPLIGLVNIAKGDHQIAQLGLVNWNTKSFSGLQAGLINTTGGDFHGAQWGLVNTSIGNVNGWQGGLVNSAGSFQGAQTGLVNVTKKLNGLQLGLVNYADSIESGVPIGLVSIVRNGGYHAVEYSFSEFYPITLGLKLGVEKFYTTIFAAYNSDGSDFALGFGLGSIWTINESFFFNPELNWMPPIVFDFDEDDNRHVSSFIPYFGYNINKTFSVVAGPSVSWVHDDNGNPREPLFKIYNHKINDNNSIVVGARAGVRLRF